MTTFTKTVKTCSFSSNGYAIAGDISGKIRIFDSNYNSLVNLTTNIDIINIVWLTEENTFAVSGTSSPVTYVEIYKIEESSVTLKQNLTISSTAAEIRDMEINFATDTFAIGDDKGYIQIR